MTEPQRRPACCTLLAHGLYVMHLLGITWWCLSAALLVDRMGLGGGVAADRLHVGNLALASSLSNLVGNCHLAMASVF